MGLCQKAPGHRAGSRRRSSDACTGAARSSGWPCSASRTCMRAAPQILHTPHTGLCEDMSAFAQQSRNAMIMI